MRPGIAALLVMALAACGGGSDAPTLNFQAEKLGRVDGPGACGVNNAYRVTEASGILLTTPATLSKRAAERLNFWLSERAIPEVGNKGGGLIAIRVAAHYACRTRNSRPGARLSEHAKGNAIDISAFILADGTILTVEDNWNGPNSRLMRSLHASACGPFGTVLGPNADRFHQDHFHFDVASYRSGTYCR